MTDESLRRCVDCGLTFISKGTWAFHRQSCKARHRNEAAKAATEQRGAYANPARSDIVTQALLALATGPPPEG